MPTLDANAVARLPFLEAADLQDHLLSAANDLERLQALLGAAGAALLAGCLGATTELRALGVATGRADDATGTAADEAVGRAIAHLDGAAAALQFEDLSSQLLAHTRRRLRHCTDRLAQAAFGTDDGADGDAVVETAPIRPNPVAQDEMDAGAIELF